MDEHKKYLVDRLLSEEKPITYRLLSRSLDVHVNTAKEMLYDFHAYQNAQKAGSIHATYLVYGKKAHGTNEDEDVEMGSSQSEYDDEDEVSTTTLSIVREENLEDVLSEYEEVTSIHIYSLSPQRQKDLTLLAGLSKSLLEYQTEDYTKAALKYGTITNSQVRRRPRTLKPPVPPSAKPIKVQPAVKPEEVAKAAKSLVKPGTAITAAAPVTNVKQDLPEHPKKPAPVKRGGSGGLAAAFAKAAAMPSKPKPAPKKEENAMALSDDGEADDNDIAPARKPAKTSTNVAQEAEETRKSRKDREAALRKMMEESDDDEEEANEEDADEEMEEALEPEPESEPVQEKEEPAEVVSSTGDGRRRGKRRVMKKKRILDDQGYMVTIQEQGWESFSEDEAPPPAKKVAMEPTLATSGAKGKKAAAKGQGNIMSFFSKK